MNRDPLLAACVCSGQASAEQVHQHVKAGELPITMLEDEHGVVSGETTVQTLALEIADEAARSDVECMAQCMPLSNEGMPVYDLGSLSSELPTDDDMQQDYRGALAKAVRYLDLRKLLVRPVMGSPWLVAFRRHA